MEAAMDELESSKEVQLNFGSAVGAWMGKRLAAYRPRLTETGGFNR
jgi:hypothetical protein